MAKNNLGWSKHDHDRAVALQAAGKTIREIAKELGRTNGAVSGRLYRGDSTHRAVRKPGRPAKITPPEKRGPSQYNTPTMVFKKARTGPELTKSELRALLRKAVENTR